MIKVLLADDNKMSLKYFSELIIWEDYGYELVSKAVDGENAWYDFQKYRPEVVIADIQMPVISGIELAEKILNFNPGTVILFLSSYSEFQYARAAVKLRVHDYLLKHETTKEVLIKKLEEIREHLENEREKYTLLAKEEITSLFFQKRNDAKDRKSRNSFLPDKYDCFFLELDHEFPFLAKVLGDLKKIQLISGNGREEGMNGSLAVDAEQRIRECSSSFDNSIALVPMTDFEFLLITTPNENPYDFCCRFQRSVRARMSRQCSVVILQKNQSILECASFFNKVRPFLSQIYFYPQSAIIEGTYLTDSSDKVSGTELKNMNCRIDKSALEVMEQDYRKITEAKDYESFCRVAEAWLDILMTYDRRMIHPSSGQIVELFLEKDMPVGCDINGVYNWIHQKFVKLIDILGLVKFGEPSDIVREAVFLISSSYGNYDLNVEWIAEKLKTSPSNLNIQFLF